MATGDLEGNLERLRVQLRTISYPHPLDMNRLREGNPASVLPLLHYALLGYSRHVSRYLSESGYALFAKSDLRFVECTLKYLRKEHAYRCPLTVAQILSFGFAERKFLFVHDVIQVCKRKHSELVKQARKAQQARKTIKRNTILRDIAKNIDASNMDILRADDKLSMALDKISQAQGHANNTYTSELNLESTCDNDSCRQTQSTKAHSKGERNFPEKEETSAREMDVGSKAKELEMGMNGILHPVYLGRLIALNFLLLCEVTAQQNQSSSFGNSDAAIKSACDVDASLSQCYDKLRTQIIEVAEKMERLLLNLKGDVQRITSDMQFKVSCLEKQALYLGQAMPLKNPTMLQAPLSYNAFQLYQASFPFKTAETSTAQSPFIHTATGSIDNLQPSVPQTQISMVGSYINHPEELSTEKLIATVKARCNKTKELLSETEWIGPA